jgi:transcriptional regulator with XRE-family HTH domain
LNTVDVMEKVMQEEGYSQKQFSEKMHVHSSYISKLKSRERKWNENNDANLADVDYRCALHLAEERTGGYYGDLTSLVDGFDDNPSSVKELLQKEIDELEEALDESVLAGHIRIDQEMAETLWLENKDVLDHAAVLSGVLIKNFGLNKDELVRKYKQKVREEQR